MVSLWFCKKAEKEALPRCSEGDCQTSPIGDIECPAWMRNRGQLGTEETRHGIGLGTAEGHPQRCTGSAYLRRLGV